jgi:hypothetical protein
MSFQPPSLPHERDPIFLPPGAKALFAKELDHLFNEKWLVKSILYPFYAPQSPIFTYYNAVSNSFYAKGKKVSPNLGDLLQKIWLHDLKRSCFFHYLESPPPHLKPGNRENIFNIKHTEESFIFSTLYKLNECSARDSRIGGIDNSPEDVFQRFKQNNFYLSALDSLIFLSNIILYVDQLQPPSPFPSDEDEDFLLPPPPTSSVNNECLHLHFTVIHENDFTSNQSVCLICKKNIRTSSSGKVYKGKTW